MAHLKIAKQCRGLAERLGPHLLEKRMTLQVHHAEKVLSLRSTRIHPENMYGLHRILECFLWCLGMYKKGSEEFRKIQLVRREVPLPRLPRAFDGFRILQLTDLHLDGDPKFVEALIHQLKQIPPDHYDLCAITGDFRFKTSGPYQECLRLLERVLPHIHKPTFCVLGNHDFIEMVVPLEEMGCRVLLNEHVQIERDGDSLYLVGVDDPHFYKCQDLEKATLEIPEEAVKVLLVHAPNIYKEARKYGIDFLMCGHTHGGQVCLPGGIPLIVNSRVPRKFACGEWSYQGMQAYTSKGTGGSGLPVRFNCPPEITLHCLRCQEVGQ